MTRDEFKKSIGFTRKNDDFGNCVISGGVIFKHAIMVHKDYIDDIRAVQHAEDMIREEILAKVYDDKRRQFADKIMELEMCHMMDFSKWRKIASEIMDMARAL